MENALEGHDVIRKNPWTTLLLPLWVLFLSTGAVLGHKKNTTW
jgi:hypothetical protein